MDSGGRTAESGRNLERAGAGDALDIVVRIDHQRGWQRERAREAQNSANHQPMRGTGENIGGIIDRHRNGGLVGTERPKAIIGHRAANCPLGPENAIRGGQQAAAHIHRINRARKSAKFADWIFAESHRFGLLQLQTVRRRLDHGRVRVAAFGIRVGIADVFQRHSLTHDAAF